MRKRVFFPGLAIALLLAPHPASAQGRSLVEEMQQRLLQMQKQMMQGLQGLENTGDSSGIYFHFDTTFDGGGNAHFFRFTPPGDSLGGDPSDLEEFFRGMFDFDSPSGSAGAQSFPKDDGNLPHPDDEMLPEDRLRLQEEQSAANPGAPPKPAPAPVRKKPQVTSIRI